MKVRTAHSILVCGHKNTSPPQPTAVRMSSSSRLGPLPSLDVCFLHWSGLFSLLHDSQDLRLSTRCDYFHVNNVASARGKFIRGPQAEMCAACQCDLCALLLRTFSRTRFYCVAHTFVDIVCLLIHVYICSHTKRFAKPRGSVCRDRPAFLRRLAGRVP